MGLWKGGKEHPGDVALDTGQGRKWEGGEGSREEEMKGQLGTKEGECIELGPRRSNTGARPWAGA